MPVLLAIDDEPLILGYYRSAFPEPEITLATASSGAEGLECFATAHPDVVLLDINLPDQSGLEIFRRLHEIDRKVPVIFATGQGTTSSAIEAMRLGAYEYLLKPFKLAQLRELVFRALEVSRLMRVPAVLAEAAPSEDASDVLVGQSASMQEVYKSIGRVAPQDVTVLVLGESGTGKELVARAIYHYSRRSAGPFLAINCAAIPEALLESELFGHERGSFTGAVQRRIGKFEQCSGGTLFLDEVGDMTPLTQTKILRVLQEQQFERIGGNETIKTNVRLIAATNRHLEHLVATGQFRKDLYYRLNVYTIKLPPLRERPDDLPLIVEHFLRRFARELGKDVQCIAPPALEALRRYPWPGNLRELQSVLKHALLQATGLILVPEFLPDNVRVHDKPAAPHLPTSSFTALDEFIEERLHAGSRDLHAECLALTERHLLPKVLRQTQGNLSQAAKILGIHRATLRTKVAALGIKIEDQSPDTEPPV